MNNSWSRTFFPSCFPNPINETTGIIFSCLSHSATAQQNQTAVEREKLGLLSLKPPPPPSGRVIHQLYEAGVTAACRRGITPRHYSPPGFRWMGDSVRTLLPRQETGRSRGGSHIYYMHNICGVTMRMQDNCPVI